MSDEASPSSDSAPLDYRTRTDGDLVLLRVVPTAWEARLVAAKVESEGVKSFIVDEHSNLIGYAQGQLTGGVKVMVRSKDLSDAQRILDVKPGPVDEDDLNLEQCPHCGGSDFVLSRRADTASKIKAILTLGFSRLLEPEELRCRSCGIVLE